METFLLIDVVRVNPYKYVVFNQSLEIQMTDVTMLVQLTL